jgi:tRNA C32,U32 (ribose-2'-O)-methylase TrmJ
MPLAIAVEFKNLIKEKLKIDYADVEKAYSRVIERILKNEKIANSQEYELVVNRIDEIFTDHTRAEELKTLNQLLTEFEDQNKK